MLQSLRRPAMAVAVTIGLAAGALTGGEAALGAPMPLSIETAASAFDLSPAKEVLVTCPGDSEVLGGGADVIGGARRVHIVRSQPSPSQNGWQCPGTKRLIGLGASMTGADGHAGYTSLTPDTAALTVESTVDPTGTPAPFTTRAQAVCAFPYSAGE